MARLMFDNVYGVDATLEDLRSTAIRRISADPMSNCPVDYTSTILKLCASQSCGKCVPCRIGIIQMAEIIERILDGKGSVEDLDLLERTAKAVQSMSDCVIGTEAGRITLAGLSVYRDDYMRHLEGGRCRASFRSVPCATFCPAHINVPAYIALVREGRNEDAMRVIRNTNPFPSVCAYICEHPCENVCRRGMVDAPVNIRALKRAAVDNVGEPQLPPKCDATGKRVAVIGGGPAGLTAAYYLALMGHAVTVFEQNDKLGGMLRYGIPRYRLPAENLDYDIDAILSLGVEVEFNTKVGSDIRFDRIDDAYDGVFVAIGAHQGKSLGVEGEESDGVLSAVGFLHAVEDGDPPDLAGKDVAVVGGGNVAMDASRTALRLGARTVSCVYRRRKEDMTALPDEVDAACEEGVQLIPLQAPLRVEEAGGRLKLHVQAQMAGEYSWGRPRPVALADGEGAIACDVVISAIGQAVEFELFESAGLQMDRGTFKYEANAIGAGCSKTFVGGDCATGPATVIKAIEAGRVAAANIDELLGFGHSVFDKVDVPIARFEEVVQTGRANTVERPVARRVGDFAGVELPLRPEEICQEAGRCLRCDHFGLGAFRVGRSVKW